MTDMEREVRGIIEQLRAQGSERNRSGMGRYGINVDRAFGMSIPSLRGTARLIGRNHELALALWASGWHEARLLAVFIDEAERITAEQMDRWAGDFDSWDITDQCCSNLFIRTPFAERKVREWARREEEFVRRAAFAMIAALAVHSTTMTDEDFRSMLVLVCEAADDERNFVRKAVNWALRQTGKRNMALHAEALAAAEALALRPSKAARWIARDALRELRKPETIARIASKRQRRG
jgi:3-methyladenine DNA glycosylase AlkD